MKHIFKIIALVVITLIVGLIIVVSKAEAGGPWSDQYCDVEITKIKIVDAQGVVKRNAQKRSWYAMTVQRISYTVWA